MQQRQNVVPLQHINRVQQQNKRWNMHQAQHKAHHPVQKRDEPVQRRDEFDAYQPTLFVSPISANIGLGQLYDFFNNCGFGRVKEVFIKPSQHQDFAVISFHHWNVRETVDARNQLSQGRFIKMQYWHSPTNIEQWKVFEYKKPIERKPVAGRKHTLNLSYGPPPQQVERVPDSSVSLASSLAAVDVNTCGNTLHSTDTAATDCIKHDVLDGTNRIFALINVDDDVVERPEKLDYGEVMPSKPRRKIIIKRL